MPIPKKKSIPTRLSNQFNGSIPGLTGGNKNTSKLFLLVHISTTSIVTRGNVTVVVSLIACCDGISKDFRS